MDRATCANCAAPLAGPYCSQCGQHVHESSRSVGTLFHDAWHVVTHVDGRFWQTIHALAFRPGLLTKEYFAERRARYLPPVRLYLVLSVILFAFASTGQHSRGVLFDLDSKTAETDPARAAELAKIKQEAKDAIKEARAQGVPIAAIDGDTDGDSDKDEKGGLGFRMDAAKCASTHTDWKWLEQPLRDVCLRNAADHGAGFIRALNSSIPKMMFVFLPLMALVMLLLYWWPRHYYVEHLVFFLHTHAAIFMLLLVELVVSRLSAWLPFLTRAGPYLKLAGVLYCIWYIYRAMRVYYGQGRWLTLTKISVIGFSYMIFLSITFFATAILVALIA